MQDREQRRIDEQKRLFDMITKAWLDEKFATFGRWTFKSIMALIFIFVLKVIIHLNSNDLRSLIESVNQAQDMSR
jgi:hypothetical protein